MTLIGLLALVLALNLLTFGNAPVMVPLLQKELVEDRHVLTLDQLLYAFAIARVTPGQANMYVAAIGYFLFGLPGAIGTLLAMVAPSYMIVPLVAFYGRVRDRPLVAAFISGLTAASVGVILAATTQIARGSLTGLDAWIVFAVALALLATGRIPAIAALILASLAGVGLHLLG